MSVVVAAAGAILGFVSIAGLTAWYARFGLPLLYEDQSIVPFVTFVSIAALSVLTVVGGAWRRRHGHRDGLPTMILADFVLFIAIYATLTTMGPFLVPSFLLVTLATALSGSENQQGCS